MGVVAKGEICYPLSYDRFDHYICGFRRLDLSGTSGQRRKVQKNFDNLAQQTQLEAPPGGEVSSSNDAVPPVEADEPIDAAVHKRDIAVLAAENTDCI